jgi:signal transduction histidine kinase
MHPILLNRTRLVLYFLVWAPLGIALAFLLHRQGHLGWTQSSLSSAGLSLFYALVCLSPWYSCPYLPIEPSTISKVLINHSAAAIMASALLIGIAKLMGVPTPQFPLLLAGGVLLYLLAVALHYVLFSFQSSREAETREQEARVLAREAELKALKAQINPHFLFNSLNSISALATVDGQRAREMCIRLSDFLRSTLNLAEKESIPLNQEMTLAKTYLDVERVRFGERLRVEQTIGPLCEGCMVPSLILQPLVENAVKHGIAGMVEGGWILVAAHCTEGVLHILVENDFDPDARPAARNGLGLVNIRNRLKARYQNRARLDTEVRDNRFCAYLELPCDS